MLHNRTWERGVHTSKDGAELLPAGDAALWRELTKGDLQEEDRQTSAKQENEVGDEKCTWVEGRKNWKREREREKMTFRDGWKEGGVSEDIKDKDQGEKKDKRENSQHEFKVEDAW